MVKPIGYLKSKVDTVIDTEVRKPVQFAVAVSLTAVFIAIAAFIYKSVK